MAMKIEFDPAKDAANIAKHGCSLALAAEFEWDDAIIVPDERYDYGEDRFSATGYIGLRFYILIFVVRDDVRRIISLRKANPREIRKYAQA
jgi:uncharacterized protein